MRRSTSLALLLSVALAMLLPMALASVPPDTPTASSPSPLPSGSDRSSQRDDAGRSSPSSLPFAERVFVDNQSAKHRYRVLLPIDFQAEPSKRYPLVLFLHGAGERGDDNQAQLKHAMAEFASQARRSQYPCIVIAPQCPREQQWVSVPWTDATGTNTFPDHPSLALNAALGIVDEWLQSGRVDKARVYVTGLSMGGYGTWFAAAHKNDWFAAAIPICGGGDPQWAARYGSLPVWAFHGSADTTVPVRRSVEMIDALKQAGHRPEPRYTEYVGVGHNAWTDTYKRDDVFEWLFSQRK